MPSKSSSLILRGAAAAAAFGYRHYFGSSTRTVTERDPAMNVNIEQGEYTRKRYRTGRYKRKNVRRAFTILKSLTDRIIFRLEGCNPYCTNLGGRLALWNYRTPAYVGGVPQPGTTTLPMHIYDLSIVNNTTTTSGLPIAWVPQAVSGTPENVVLTPLQNSAYTGGNSTWSDFDGGFQAQPVMWIEKGTNGITTLDVQHSVLKWADIKLMLYGTKNMPTMYDIMLCYIPDYLYNPYFHIDYTSSQNPEWRNFIQELTVKFAFNPLHNMDASMNKFVKKIWHKQFVIQTPVTNEGDASVPHFKEVHLFKKFDQIQNYNWKDTTAQDAVNIPVGAHQQNFQDAYNEQVTTQARNYPDYKNHCFLIIRAIAGSKNGAALPTVSDTTDTPTYDIILRKCHEYASL